MDRNRNLVLTISMVLGFGVLGAIFTGLDGFHAEIVGMLVAGCALSIFVLWVASLQPKSR